MGLLRALIDQLKTRLWPLRPTLVTSVMVIIIFTMFAIGLPSYFSGRKAVKDLWRNLATQIATSTGEVSLRFLSSAEPAGHILKSMAERGDLDVNNRAKILDFAGDVLQSYADFTWVAFAAVNGDYTSAYRLPNDAEVYGTIRTIQNYSSSQTPQTKDEEYTWNNKLWTLKQTLTNDYDPRLRPFWTEGVTKEGGSWSAPFKDWQTGRPSFSYTLTQKDAKGVLQGLWEIEFRADYLSEFLAGIKVGKSGEIWILTEQGVVIASSKGALFGTQSVYDIKAENPILFEAWQELQMQGERIAEFSFGDFFAYIEPLPNNSSMPWKILTIVPKSDFLGPIEFMSWILLGCGILLCIFFSFVGALFFGHISEQLMAVAYEMKELGNLKISDEVFSRKPTFVKEVQIMNTATDRLKIGLSSFAKYVPVDLIHNLIQSGQPAKLGGRKNEMTVLFSDLTKFTELAEQLPPVRLLEILSEYFTEMSLIIQNNKGQVDKFIGDAIMAFWGAPEAYKEHAKSACNTALAMRARLTELGDRWKISNMPFLSQRIGINTGTMIVGNIGSPYRMQYTVIGDAVNLGSRLEGLNKFYGTQILVSEDTAKQAGPEFVFRPLDWVYVKGRVQTSLVYELVGKTDSMPLALRKAIDLYEQALYLYRNREFIKAAQKFEEAHDAFEGNDPPSSLMAARSRDYVLHPPPGDWAGALLMEHK